MSKPYYWANRDHWQLEMCWNDLANSDCLWTWGYSQIPLSLPGALPAVVLPASPSRMGEQLGCWVQLGPEDGRMRGGVSIDAALLSEAAALCCFSLPRCPRRSHSSSLCIRWMWQYPRMTASCLRLAQWGVSGGTMSLEQARWTTGKIIF